MVKTVDLSEPNASLAELVSLVTSGTQVLVTRAGNPVARLVAVDAVIESQASDVHPGSLEPSEDSGPLHSHEDIRPSIYDAFGMAKQLRTAEDLDAQLEEERAAWDAP